MGHFRVVSPIDGKPFLERETAEKHTIQKTLARAKEAQRDWAERTLMERAQICERFVCAMEANQERIGEDICRQMGRPKHQAIGEMKGMAERARTMIALAEEALAPVVPPKKSGVERWVQRNPKGVVFVIAPWNYPLLTAVNVIVPALMAGNSVVLKHARQTPLCAEHFSSAFEMAELPEGVFQHLHLDYEGTEQVIQSDIHLVAFTGSVLGGRAIQRAAVDQFVSINLELGGKDPAYVRADADIDSVVPQLVDGAFYNSGQSCCAIERIYVHESQYRAFVERYVANVQKYQLGNPLEKNSTLGPMVNASSADRVRADIAAAMEAGATTWLSDADFEAASGTAYCAPQVLTDVTHDMPIMQKESFGPLVTIMPVSSDEQAISLMNDSDFGLTASVWTADLETAKQIGQRVQTGTFLMNQCDTVDPHLAWTGLKHTGRGCSLSALGYEHLTQPKSFSFKVSST